MHPNKHLTSGSHLQIPLNALQRPPSIPSDAPSNGSAQRLASEPAKQGEDSPLALRNSALEPADFSTAELSQQQIIVLRAIAGGKGISAAAQEAGVSRPTIYRWKRDPHFQKWLAAWQHQTKESGRNIMLSLIERSTRVLDRALDKDDVRVALTVLTKLGVLAANDEPNVLPAIPGEGTSNEPEMKNGDVASSRQV